MDVKQAAEALGISSEGVRQRIRRGSLESEKDADGRVYVWLDNTDGFHERRADGRTDAVVERLESENEFLRRELATRDEEIRRRDAILLNMTEGLKALSPPPGTRESRETATEGEDKGTAPTAQAQESLRQRSWVYRFFFGPST